MAINRRMNPKYYAHLKLPFDLDLRATAKFKCNPMELGHALKNVADIDQRLIDFLAAYHIKIGHAEAFYTPPKRFLPIHVDHDKFSDLAKMNFVYGANGSTMSWWELNDPNFEPLVRLTSVGTKYIYVNQDDAHMVETVQVGRPTLVNVGRPHSVSNTTPAMRFCLSLVMWGSDVQRDLTISECIERLKEFVQ
jgi:hypothetical protein